MDKKPHGLGAALAALSSWLLILLLDVDVPPGVESAMAVVFGVIVRRIYPSDLDGDGIDDVVVEVDDA